MSSAVNPLNSTMLAASHDSCARVWHTSSASDPTDLNLHQVASSTSTRSIPTAQKNVEAHKEHAQDYLQITPAPATARRQGIPGSVNWTVEKQYIPLEGRFNSGDEKSVDEMSCPSDRSPYQEDRTHRQHAPVARLTLCLFRQCNPQQLHQRRYRVDKLSTLGHCHQ